MRLGLEGHDLLKILTTYMGSIEGFLSFKRKTSLIPALLVQFGLFVFVTLL